MALTGRLRAGARGIEDAVGIGMESHFTFEQDGRLVRVVARGPFQGPAFAALYRDLLGDRRWLPGASVIWDLRRVSMDPLESHDVRHITESVLALRDRRGDGKSAWVVDDELAYSMSTMFQLLAKHELRVDFVVFRTLDDAERWLVPEGERPAAGGVP